MRTSILNNNGDIICIVHWQKAMIVYLKGVMNALEFQDRTIMSAGGVEYEVPKVMMVKKYVKHRKKHSPTKRNIYLRDNYTCQYCGSKKVETLTIDHVIPSSRGGENTWENLVAACFKCNSKKANRTPEEADMKLATEPMNPIYSTWMK